MLAVTHNKPRPPTQYRTTVMKRRPVTQGLPHPILWHAAMKQVNMAVGYSLPLHVGLCSISHS